MDVIQPRTVIERAVIQFGGARTAAGPIQAVVSRTCDVLPVVACTAEILHPGTDLTEQTERFEPVVLRSEGERLVTLAGRSLAHGLAHRC